MRNLLGLLFIALTQSFAFGGPLTSIGNDTCWYREGEMKTKITSFNDNVALNTTKDEVLGELVQYLNKSKYTPERIDAIHTYGLCGPRLAFAFRINYDKIDYCVRAQMTADKKFSFSEVGLSNGLGGACELINSSKLIVIAKQTDMAQLKDYLKSRGRNLAKLETISQTTFIFEFKTIGDEIKEIKKEIEESKLARSVDFSTGQYHIADEFELLSLSYFRK